MRPLLTLVLLLSATHARAEATLPFDLDELALNATDVVVADRTGSQLTIVETWHGSLAKGATITVPHVPVPLPACCPVRPLANKRLVLFLVKQGGSWRGAAPYRIAARDAARISVAWVDGGDVYALRGMSSDEQAFSLKVDTLANVRAVVDEYRKVRDTLANLDKLPSIDKRMEAIDPLVRHSRQLIGATAITKLGTLGAPAVPRLLALVDDTQLRTLREVAVNALATAAGPDAAKQLAALLAREAVFWKAAAPQLAAIVKKSKDKSWWNEIGEPAVVDFRDRYGLALTTLVTLARTGGGKSQPALAQFCALWSTLPVSGYDDVVDGSGSRKVPSSQIREACDRALSR